ncbi:MAG: TlpA family protein disulfide reductase, partial [Dysgonamonadaceae bacterium]|nr:TlpA family protein disulfide reductase [Dysgonamonadaceae bacterium]
SDKTSSLRVGSPFPDFTVTSLNNKAFSQKQLTGKITLVNFWYQSCAPCVAEMDALNDLYHKFKDNPSFQFLSFTFDSIQVAKANVRKFDIPYEVLSITEKEAKRLNSSCMYPTTAIIDQRGRVVFIKSGGNIDKVKVAIDMQKIEPLIAFLLMQQSSGNEFIYAVSPSTPSTMSVNVVQKKPDTTVSAIQPSDDLLALYFHQRNSINESKIGTPFLDFTAKNLNKKTISEKQLKGKITFINLWFQACPPCLAEMDALNDLYHKFKDNPSFQFLSFTFDSPEDARIMVKKFDMPYDVLPVTEKECHRLNFGNGFPTNMIVDQSGKIVFLQTGGHTDVAKAAIEVQEFEQEIAELLDEE